MKISVVTENQLPLVQDLANKIWPSTYGEILSKEQLHYMLDKFYSSENLKLQLNSNHVFLLIQEQNFYLGYLDYELNYENSNKTKIHKIYVLPETQGKGIGKTFVQYVQKIAKKANQKGILLNVNRFNKAIGFYENLGFQKTQTLDVEIGNGYLMEDFIMEKEIHSTSNANNLLS
jgi:ribosomal protein S18 acetylase RimI-like enzyme